MASVPFPLHMHRTITCKIWGVAAPVDGSKVNFWSYDDFQKQINFHYYRKPFLKFPNWVSFYFQLSLPNHHFRDWGNITQYLFLKFTSTIFGHIHISWASKTRRQVLPIQHLALILRLIVSPISISSPRCHIPRWINFSN